MDTGFESDKMKVLLINPPWSIKEQYATEIYRVGAVLPPLGLAYIASVLEENGYGVEILDCIAQQIILDSLGKQIESRKPDIIGITCLTPMAPRSMEAARVAKEAAPNSIVVLGGAHPSVLPTETLQDNSIDIAVVGEGEHTMLELVRCIEAKGNLEKVPGVVFRKNGELIKTLPRPLTDLDLLPLPARHLLPMKRYRPTAANHRRLPCHTMITSRGCPFNCTYCSNAIFGRKYRASSPQNVVKEMEHLVSEYGAKEILFWDDVFTLNQQRTGRICELIIERGLNIPWTCESRVDCVTEDLLAQMRKAGCWQIGYGVESGDQEVIDTIKKGITLEQVEEAFKWTKKAGIDTRAYLMIGLPGETREQVLKTIDIAKRLDADIAQFCITTPYPGTELFETAKNEGTLKTVDWLNYILIPDEPVYVTKLLTAEDLRYLLQKAYKEFYFRPSYIVKRMLKTRSLSDVRKYKEAFLAILSLKER